MFSFSQLVKINQTNQGLVNHMRLIQKKYFRYPKETSYFKHMKQDLDEYFFQFQCNQNKINFEQKLEILETVVKLKPNTLYSDIMGIQNIIKSISVEIQGTQYKDEVELNISQYINILHSIGYYDKPIWFSAIDNYHKQGNLNWQQYKSFTESLFHFQHLLKEEWHQNIVKDISQEAWNDFVGFIENSERLEIEPEELLNTYQNIRKFKQFATQNNLRSIINYYGKHLEKKAQDPSYIIQTSINEFLLSFIIDHVQQQELVQGLEKLFNYLMLSILQEGGNFKKLDSLLRDASSYIPTLRLAQQYYFHNLFENNVIQAWSQEMYLLFMDKKLNDDVYSQMENLIQLKFIIQQLKMSFFSEQQVDDMVQLIDQQALENVKTVTVNSQNLYSLINFFKTFEDEDQQSQYLKVLGQAHITLKNVISTDVELMQCLQELDGEDMAYYLTDLMESILDYVTANLDNFSAEDWSMTYYIVYKYLVKGNNLEEFDHLTVNLNILKQFIKLHFTSNYRKAIPLQSNFYKILSVVELETFYADDLINYY